MIVLSAANITKEYGTDIIIKDISFHLNEGDRVGLIGKNGEGKTTLMNILAGELTPSSGDIFISRDKTIGYLKQAGNFNSENTIIEEAERIFENVRKLEEDMTVLSERIAQMSKQGRNVSSLLAEYDKMTVRFEQMGGYTYKSEIIGILGSMAFSENIYGKKISTLSGGERTRLALACLLLKKPDILFLDEPTNHLDLGTLKWLEQFLKSYRGTILIVSHDRYFLDRTVTRIFEIENHKLYTYEGNYSSFAVKKKQREEAEIRKYEKQQTEIARQEEIIRRFKQHGTELLAKRASSREKLLEHMEIVERPEISRAKIKINLKENFKSGNDVLLGEGLTKSFGSERTGGKRTLFSNVSFDIKRGERICFVGANGVGKTTLLRIMLGELEQNDGYLKRGHNIEFGYYDQGQMRLNDSSTVLEELKDAYRLYTDTEMRNILARFLFRGDDIFVQVGSLSGGERARLALLKLMLSGANVLALDEPTNHLDISSKEVFEDALLQFSGTIIIVSHDRYLLNKIPTRILELTEEGITEYLGTYDYYVEKKQSIESGKKYLEEIKNLTNTSQLGEQKYAASSEEERRLKKERDAKERRKARILKELEDEIENLENKIENLEAELCLPENMTDYEKLTRIGEELEECKSMLNRKIEEWGSNAE
ncbi:MAG: ABC-F family ATP-binding cassette domain-containing protein [Eubacteriales bacterium]|nr:ABC-F family ATP-binding cassette domain-containing protein [Eubacteriales bacterium]MDD4390875.1 ABC-F family ATP-binding cassette domain-containing protein [Eubacteriales bacterium]